MGIKFERADPESLARFNPETKICTMNCGPHKDDPRSTKERKFLCGDCYPNARQSTTATLTRKAERVSGSATWATTAKMADRLAASALLQFHSLCGGIHSSISLK